MRKLIILIYCMSLLLIFGCMSSRTLVSCEDVVILPNRKITLRAKLEERDYHLDDIEGQPVEFQLVSFPKCAKRAFLGHEISRVITDDDGWAELEVGIPCEGLYRVRVSYSGNRRFLSSSDELLILAVDRNMPVIVVDIDGTLTQKSWRPWRKKYVPYDGFVVESLKQISKKYAIVYLSGRPLPLHKYTRNWLCRNGFPAGPILLWWITSPRWLTVTNYKTDMLISLKRAGVNLAWGIGNTEDDIKAYRKAGLKAIILNNEAAGAIKANSWYEIRKIILNQ